VSRAARTNESDIGLRSWFWLLTKRTNSRILQDKKVLEVLDAVTSQPKILLPAPWRNRPAVSWAVARVLS
jgi:uncharacterized protein involved in type VI secretion and phage assembly